MAGHRALRTDYHDMRERYAQSPAKATQSIMRR